MLGGVSCLHETSQDQLCSNTKIPRINFQNSKIQNDSKFSKNSNIVDLVLRKGIVHDWMIPKSQILKVEDRKPTPK